MNKEIKGQAMIRGAMILAGAVFISRVIGLIYKIPINNVLGDDGIAIYSGAYSVYALLLTFSAIGVPAAISKLVSERVAEGRYQDAHRVFKVALLYSTLIGLTTCVALWFGAEKVSVFLTRNKALTMPLRALSPTLVVVSVIAIIRGYFQGMGNMIPSATSQVIEQIFNAVCSVALAYLFIPQGIVASATGSTMGPGIGAVASLIFLSIIYAIGYKKMHRLVKEKEEPGKKESTRSILKQVLMLVIPILLTSSIFSLTTTIDQKMLYEKLPSSIAYLEEKGQLDLVPVSGKYEEGSLAIDVENITGRLIGQYMSKYVTILNLPISIILQLATAAMPAIAGAMMLKNYGDLRRKVTILLKTGMLLAAPAALGLTVFGKQIVPLLFSAAPDGGELIMVGAIGVIPMAVAQLTGGMLQGMGKQRVPVRNALIACVLKVILNSLLLMIPYLHIYSVVYSTMICYCVYAYLNLRMLIKTIDLKIDWNKLFIKPILAAVIMGVLAYMLFRSLCYVSPITFLWLVISMGAAVGIYGIVLMIIGGITKEEVGNFPGGKYLERWMK